MLGANVVNNARLLSLRILMLLDLAGAKLLN
jgi:hypothetical protein